MEEIANNIFIESGFPGVVLGVINLREGTILVDAPFRPEDQYYWRSQLTALGVRDNKLLAMLDTHIDRTLGVRSMEINVLGHENAVEIIRNRPTSARGQDFDAGAAWVSYDLPINFRWAVPNMTYSDQLSVYWDDSPVVLSHQPGAHLAGTWLRYDHEKVIFVGDSVVVNQPPFIAWSDLDRWQADLRWLASEAFKGYKIISGRCGIIRVKSIEKMIAHIERIQGVIKEIAAEDCSYDEIADRVATLLKRFSFNKEMTDLYTHRLIWGIEQYIHRQSSATDLFEKGANE